MTPDESAAHERREARASMMIRVFRLGEEPGGDLSSCTTPEERMAMMWPLALDAWTSAGRRLPGYSRDRMPGRLVRTPSPRTDLRARQLDTGSRR